MIKRFFRSEASSGIIIFTSVILSLVIANTSLRPHFESLLNTPLGYEGGPVQLRYSLQSWINDGLMAIFFLLIGLEIKREIIKGSLSTIKTALLPVLCAVGGAIVPALIYFSMNRGSPTQGGWGIPMATDIAFALAIISMLSKRVPSSLKVFLAALAIVDDLLAILVIALFYSTHIHMKYLVYAALLALLLFTFNRLRLTRLFWYLVPGVFMWYFVHHSGVHATVAGVATAMFIPVKSKTGRSPLEKLEHFLSSPVNFVIVPLFAFANTNIRLEGGMLSGIISAPGLGIIVGLLAGKPLGILLTALIGVRTGICHLPASTNWRHIIGVGILAGIGFTMSIFITLLSFSEPLLIAEAKFSILCASFVAAIIGYMVLKRELVTASFRRL